jgi:DNA-binding protein HU-beta
MNRGELVENLSKSTGQTKADSERFLDAFISTVAKNMKRKEGVKIVGFGTFATAKRKARTGRNPQTGDTIKIPARTVPVFRPGAALKDNISKK